MAPGDLDGPLPVSFTCEAEWRRSVVGDRFAAGGAYSWAFAPVMAMEMACRLGPRPPSTSPSALYAALNRPAKVRPRRSR